MLINLINLIMLANGGGGASVFGQLPGPGAVGDGGSFGDAELVGGATKRVLGEAEGGGGSEDFGDGLGAVAQVAGEPDAGAVDLGGGLVGFDDEGGGEVGDVGLVPGDGGVGVKAEGG